VIDSIKILGVNVSAVNLDIACRMIDQFIRRKSKSYICIAPVSTIISCQEDDDYKEVINEADMVTPDGMPLVWIARMRGYKDVRRTYGPDLMLAVLNDGQKKNYRHFLYGATPETLDKLMTALKEKFPAINIAGHYAPPFRSFNEGEDQIIVDMINQSNSDILWVGLGSPKQDFWMQRHRDKINVPVIMGVGAAFDFLSGQKKQAPRWMQRSGLEWLFRLVQEPGRLWKRYLLGNSKFMWLLLKDFARKKRLAKL